MSNVAILIAVFMAAKHPTTTNCANLRDALIKVTSRDSVSGTSEEVHVDEDLDLIKDLVKKQCKDGIKRK